MPIGTLMLALVCAPPVAAFLFDTSGEQEPLGQPALNGARLALQQAKVDSPGLVAAAEFNTASDAMTTLRAAKRIAPECVIGLGFTNSSSVLIAGPEFRSAGRAFLSVGATDPCLPSRCGALLACFGDNAQAAAAAEFALAHFGKRAAVIYEGHEDYTEVLSRFFRTAFHDGGGDVVAAVEVEPGDGFAEAVAGLKSSGRAFDFVYLALEPEELSARLGAVRAAGIEVPLIGGDGLDEPAVRLSGTTPTSGVWFTTHAWLGADGATPEVQAFMRDYRAAFGADPRDAFAALGYDAVRLVMDAVSRAGSADPKAVADALAATRGFKGVTGEISFDQGGVPTKPVWIVEVQDGLPRLAAKLTPAKVPSPQPCPR